MSSSNLLKTFGVGANVAQQLATDKALRRKATGTVRGFDITDGELIEGISVINGPNPVPHNLKREAKGAFILKATDPGGGAGEIFCESADAKQIVIRANDIFTDVAVWVV